MTVAVFGESGKIEMECEYRKHPVFPKSCSLQAQIIVFFPLGRLEVSS